MNENRNGIHSKQKFWRNAEEKISSIAPSWETPEFEKSPHEILEEAKSNAVSRRSFLKFMGASAVMFGAACRRPTEQIVPAVVQSPEYTPGEALFYSTVSPEGTGLIVRTREGRPIKIAGNPEHPIGEGGVSAHEVASIMDLYDPDRLRKPAIISEGKKKYVEEGEIVDEASAKIQEGNYAILSGPINSPSTRSLINAFLRKFPGGRLVEIRQDPTLRQIAEGQRLCYGSSVIPTYNFDRANYILSIDADFLGSMILPAYFSANFAKGRDVRHGGKKMSRLVAIESMMSVTGSNADERIPVRPGDQVSVALSIASQIVVKAGRSSYAGNSAVTGVLSRYLPEKVASTIGVSEETIARIAEDLWNNRGNGLVIGGSPLAANGNNASLQIAVNLLNSILENDGITVNHEYPVMLSPGASDAEMQSFIGDLHSGKIKTLIVAGANPVYHLPESLPVKEALSKSEYILSLNDRIDETGRLAHAILPSSHYLESWSDAEPIKGHLSIGQPVIRPLYNTRSFEDRLIQLAGGSLDGHESFYAYLKSRWSSMNGSRKFWNSVLKQGHYSPARKAIKRDVRSRGFNASVLQRLPSAPDQTGLKLGFYYGIQVRDGSGANNAYRQELPDPVTKIVWSNAAVLLPETARKMNLEEGSLIDINTQSGTIRIPVHLQPGLHADAILIALGYGRTEAGKTGSGIGTSVMNLVNSGNDSFIYSGISAEIKATGKSKDLAGTQLVYRNGFNTEDRAFFAPGTLPNAPYSNSSQYDRPILLETTLAEYQKNPAGVREKLIEYPKNADIMKKWNYKDMRWHMVIDLNLCTGCSACVTSCDLENNVAMVGPEEVGRGREMHWLKIDRYYSGPEENPEVAHQPMMCQHCENAPCETVCPVAATQHNNEGLNVMAYNRCVGTRYCANNCPFKVRRFNWFENWDYMEGVKHKLKDPAQLALNPDVTIRRRGVMEKCTFCIQRIASARHEMRARGENSVQDATFVTACQEVCPTSAISFGNINDQSSRVYRLTTEEKRSYKVLDFLNVNPSVTYLAKIRNRG